MKQNVAKIMTLATIFLMDVLAGMGFDLFVPIFPELQIQFNLSAFLVETLLSVNFVGFCLSLFVVGGLAEHYGRKPIIILGLITFIAGSVCCLYETNYLFLILGRFLQGVGIAAPAILNGFMNAATGIAPVIGSYITLYFHWQGNFITLLLLGICVFIMVLLFITINQRPEIKEPLSWRGYIPLFQSKPMLLLMTFFIMNYIPNWVFVGMSPLLYMKDLHVSLTHFGYYQGALA